MTDDS